MTTSSLRTGPGIGSTGKRYSGLRSVFFTASMRADWKREPRPDPPAVLRAVADARNREQALSRVMGGSSFLALDEEALVERGEVVHRPLAPGFPPVEPVGDLSE